MSLLLRVIQLYDQASGMLLRTVVTAESRLEFQKLLGYHQTNIAGLGSFHQPEIPHKDSRAYRKLISSVLKEANMCSKLPRKTENT